MAQEKSINLLISVIVPIWNTSQALLIRCLNSIIDQTYTNLEIILIDDGSTNNCGKICDDFAIKDTRIKVVHKQNGGLSSARNAGLDMASGDYIAFVDSDDFIHIDTYQRQLKAIVAADADIVQTGYYHVKTDGGIIDKKEFKTATYTNAEEILNGFYNDGNVHAGVWTKLYSRDVLKNCRFEEGYNFEDYMMLFNLLEHCRKYVVLPDAYYHYVMSKNSITRGQMGLMGAKSRLYSPGYVLNRIKGLNANFIDHEYGHICDITIKGYIGIIGTTLIAESDKKLFKKELAGQFRKYYKNFKKSDPFKRKSLLQKAKYYSFSKSPYLAYHCSEVAYSLLKKYHKLSSRKVQS